jgi:putative transposase
LYYRLVQPPETPFPRVLAWRISNTLDAAFCVPVLEEALCVWGVPAIFNSGQGSQFTSEMFTGVLKEQGVRISMDGRNRELDNIVAERLWRSLKYEGIYLKALESKTIAREG